jgi:capsular exopolysaccharide synthesis family protein
MARNNFSIIDFFSQESAFATEFRRVLYNLLRTRKIPELKTVLVTSSTLAEGKSTISALLGITAAKKGLKTLLVDCDLRRPTMHKLFQLTREKGLCEILTKGTGIREATKRTALEKLEIITAGAAFPHPAEIFDSPAIGRLIEEAKFYHDLILLDTAPIVPVSDPMLLAQEVDGVLLVVKAGTTQREVVSRAVNIINGDSSKVIGVVLNNISRTLPHYYDYDYYGYKYEQTPDRPEKRVAEKNQESPKPPNKEKKKPSRDPREDTGKIRQQ